MNCKSSLQQSTIAEQFWFIKKSINSDKFLHIKIRGNETDFTVSMYFL